MISENKLKGYRRAEHVFGVRNHVIVVSSVHCVNSFVQEIASRVSGVIPVLHQHGCDQMGADLEQTLRTLAGLCSNSNVYGVLIVGLGCENVTPVEILRRTRRYNRVMESINVQDIGDAEDIINRGTRFVARLKEQAEEQKREAFEIGDLIVGVECGGSDSFSGISANPAVGKVSDQLVDLGATVILSEIPELIGTEALLAKRGASCDIGEQISACTQWYIRAAESIGRDLIGTNPTPGNIRGGLSTIEEKSLGCITKGGSSPIQEILQYAQPPSKKGLVIMNTPGNDGESLTGLAAGGAQMILFTTGLGTPIGHPIVPIVKIASNSQTYRRMRSFIDLNAGKILEGICLNEMEDEIFSFMLHVGCGEKTTSEKFPGSVVSINRIGPTF